MIITKYPGDHTDALRRITATCLHMDDRGLLNYMQSDVYGMWSGVPTSEWLAQDGITSGWCWGRFHEALQLESAAEANLMMVYGIGLSAMDAEDTVTEDFLAELGIDGVLARADPDVKERVHRTCFEVSRRVQEHDLGNTLLGMAYNRDNYIDRLDEYRGAFGLSTEAIKHYVSVVPDVKLYDRNSLPTGGPLPERILGVLPYDDDQPRWLDSMEYRAIELPVISALVQALKNEDNQEAMEFIAEHPAKFVRWVLTKAGVLAMH